MDYSKDNNKIKLLLELKEYHQLNKCFQICNINELSDFEKKAFVETKAALLSVQEAYVFYHKFGLNDLDLRAKILYLTGSFIEARKLALSAKEYYLLSDIYLATNRFQEARDALKSEAINAKWYYYTGRCYRKEQDYPKAIFCFEKSCQLYLKNKDFIHTAVVLESLAGCFNASGNLKKANQCFDGLKINFRSDEWRNFPHFKARAFMGWAHYQQTSGHLDKALWSLARAQNLLKNSQDSSDFIRCQLLLGYTLKDLGLFDKAIKELSRITPNEKQQLVDKYRYLALVYSELGNTKDAEYFINSAWNSIDKNDHSGRLFLLTDHAEILFLSGKARAEKTQKEIEVFRKATKNSKTAKDKILEHYALSRLAWYTKDKTIANKCQKFHFEHHLYYEAYWDTLSLAHCHIVDKEFDIAKDVLNYSPEIYSPIQDAWKYFLLACISIKQKQDKEIFYLTKAFEKIKNRKTYILKYIIHKSLISLKENDKNILYNYKCLQETEANLTDFQKKQADTVLTDVGFEVSRILDLRADPQNVVVNLNNHVIYTGNKVVLRESKHPTTWRMLEILVHNRLRFLSKEELSKKIFFKNEYHPLYDDNRIYVTISRLKNILKSKESIECVRGQYRLAQDEKIVIVK
ncbi:MAG: tetratricopeptide repeat protein [Bdellovibrio sp.]|nr:tetratricopeptide repeat protein [Bdellovibrio sp.]